MAKRTGYLVNGKFISIRELARQIGIHRMMIHRRLRYESAQDIFNNPTSATRRAQRKYQYPKGVDIASVIAQTGLKRTKIYNRLANGESILDILSSCSNPKPVVNSAERSLEEKAEARIKNNPERYGF